MSWKTSKWTWKRHGNSIPKIRGHSDYILNTQNCDLQEFFNFRGDKEVPNFRGDKGLGVIRPF